MKIAAAQIFSSEGDIVAGIEKHESLVHEAASKGVRLLLFPEMSLTGYTRVHADRLSFSLDDPRLDSLQALSLQHQMLIIAGAPIKTTAGLCIGSFILSPKRPLTVYTKQFLHTGEEEYFVPNVECNPVVELDREKVSLAICADIEEPVHAKNASANGAGLYVASLFYTPAGIGQAHEKLARYASHYRMKVLMANFVGEVEGVASAGQSAYWGANGERVSTLGENTEELLIADIPSA